VDARSLKRLLLPLAALAALAIGFGLGFALRAPAAPPRPNARALADSALLSVRDQGRLVSFAARYVSIATATETRLGLTAEKTLILPGTLRYGVDLSRLKRGDLAWDEATRTLSVTLPPLELSGPSIDVDDVRERSQGGLVMALTDAERTLDESNRRAAEADLLRQAREAEPMRRARDCAMRLVARSFAVPLRAGGVDASVAVRFVDPAGREEAAYLERSRSVEDALRDRRAGR
jgi:hypothetical protein